MPVNPLSAKVVAAYFLGTVDEESGDNITNLKLQKLLYYAQGLYVAMNGVPLFEDPIEAWDLGPVVGSVYRDSKCSKSQPIPCPEHFDPTDYPPDIREFLGAISAAFGQYSAWKLSQMTHAEPPWKASYVPNQNTVISIQMLGDFFSNMVELGRRGEAVAGEPVWPTESFQFRRRAELSDRLAPHREKLKTIARRPRSPDPILADSED